jgi:hypothetical protein
VGWTSDIGGRFAAILQTYFRLLNAGSGSRAGAPVPTLRRFGREASAWLYSGREFGTKLVGRATINIVLFFENWCGPTNSNPPSSIVHRD